MPVFDTVAGKIVGRIVAYDKDTLTLDCPGLLNISYEPAENGKKVQAKAQVLNLSLVGARYILMRAGIRGLTYRYDAWLFKLYDAYVAQLKSGQYELELCIPPVETKLQLAAAPDAQAPEVAVALMGPHDNKAVPNA